ncbi:MAG TPA: M1 family metallopeptidase [Flavobacteriaceae bacterium]|nr:M1 family metallopeptidase [Flavobacteriaceae bacterium]
MRIFIFFLLISSLQLGAQQIEKVDFKSVDALIEPNFHTKTLKGTVSYTFKTLQDTDSIFLDAHGMKLLSSGGLKKIQVADNKIWFIDSFKENRIYTVSFEYEAHPKQTFYFMTSGHEFWTQGQGKYTSHWLPSLDDTNDKMIFNLSYKVPEHLTIIGNGNLKNVQKEDGKNVWNFEMNKPMSSYLVAVAGGNYSKRIIKASSGTAIELYIKPKDEDKFDATYKHSKEIFDFLEREIGVPYPWQVYKQVPVRDFLYAGMENTSATFFAEAFIVDDIGFNDRNYINVNAHELAHQWFGNMVTAKSDEHHWLQEGFATYYALLAEKEIFGEDYFYWQLLQYAEQLQKISEEGKGESLLNPKAGSLTFYQKGAWALHILREKIGDEFFRKAVKNYLEKYAFQVASTSHFLHEVALIYSGDLSEFEQNWLRQTAFKIDEAYQSLKRSDFLMNYFKISELADRPLNSKASKFQQALKTRNDFIGQEVVHQLANENSAEALPYFQMALESGNLYIRQAVATVLEEIPGIFYHQYVTLLEDKSYLTREMALYHLWINFPEKRLVLLDKMDNQEGFQNKNIRQLWLALIIATEGAKGKIEAIEELRSYSSPDNSFEIRSKAFEFIHSLNLWDLATIKNLINATRHPAWRFSGSSKELLKRVMEIENLNTLIRDRENDFSESEREALKNYLH